jgi:cytochrome b6-f complex iron-sulfur subunit
MKLSKGSSQEGGRGAMMKLLLRWTAPIVLPSLYVIGKYLVPPVRRVAQATSVIAAKINEILLDSARIVRLGNTPLILVHTESGEYKAFSATCTHLGYIAEYRGDRGGYFHCNCHGGEYDLNGKNISGPPSRPLTPYPVSIKNQHIIITGA